MISVSDKFFFIASQKPLQTTDDIALILNSKVNNIVLRSESCPILTVEDSEYNGHSSQTEQVNQPESTTTDQAEQEEKNVDCTYVKVIGVIKVECKCALIYLLLQKQSLISVSDRLFLNFDTSQRPLQTADDSALILIAKVNSIIPRSVSCPILSIVDSQQNDHSSLTEQENQISTTDQAEQEKMVYCGELLAKHSVVTCPSNRLFLIDFDISQRPLQTADDSALILNAKVNSITPRSVSCPILSIVDSQQNDYSSLTEQENQISTVDQAEQEEKIADCGELLAKHSELCDVTCPNDRLFLIDFDTSQRPLQTADDSALILNAKVNSITPRSVSCPILSVDSHHSSLTEQENQPEISTTDQAEKEKKVNCGELLAKHSELCDVTCPSNRLFLIDFDTAQRPLQTADDSALILNTKVNSIFPRSVSCPILSIVDSQQNDHCSLTEQENQISTTDQTEQEEKIDDCGELPVKHSELCDVTCPSARLFLINFDTSRRPLQTADDSALTLNAKVNSIISHSVSCPILSTAASQQNDHNLQQDSQQAETSTTGQAEKMVNCGTPPAIHSETRPIETTDHQSVPQKQRETSSTSGPSRSVGCSYSSPVQQTPQPEPQSAYYWDSTTGMYYLLPTTQPANYPSTAFQSANGQYIAPQFVPNTSYTGHMHSDEQAGPHSNTYTAALCAYYQQSWASFYSSVLAPYFATLSSEVKQPIAMSDEEKRDVMKWRRTYSQLQQTNYFETCPTYPETAEFVAQDQSETANTSDPSIGCSYSSFAQQAQQPEAQYACYYDSTTGLYYTLPTTQPTTYSQYSHQYSQPIYNPYNYATSYGYNQPGTFEPTVLHSHFQSDYSPAYPLVNGPYETSPHISQ